MDPHASPFIGFDALPIGACVIDQSFRIRYWNRCLEQWTNTSRDALLGQDIRAHFPRLGIGGVLSRLLAVLEGGPPALFSPQLHAGLFEARCPRGELRVQQTMAHPVEYGDGRRLALLTVQDLTDLSRRVQQYYELRQQALEEVETRRRAEEALRQAKLAAEGIARDKSEFLANMSHEIRTPMTAILGYAELLGSGNIDASEQDAMLEAIRINGEHLLNVINAVLDHSKIEAGELALERIECSPARIVLEVLDMLRQKAEEKGLRLRADVDGWVPTRILSDPTRLRQILVNLVGNAIKFTQDGGVELRLRCHEVGPDAGRLEIDIIDTGIGMTEDEQRRALEPFGQADGSTSRRFGGTGLGLTISQRLIEALGGQLEVHSELGRGTRMNVEIPTGSLEGSERVHELRLASPQTKEVDAELTSLPGCRVLLVEDNVVNQRLISRILELAEIEADVVDNGREALKWILRAQDMRQPYDIVLMDMQMPVLDGYETTRVLRQQNYAGTIIALTAHAMSEDRERCLAAGCDDYEMKPVRRARFLRTLAKYFGASDRRAA